MHGIYRGAYLVIFKPTIGGKLVADIGMVVAGFGTSVEPWEVLSRQTWQRHRVKAIEIAQDSYYNNSELADAETIFKRVTGNNPVYISKPVPERVQLDIDPL